MEITDVRIFIVNEEKLQAYASMTFDDCFVVRDLKIIRGNEGLFVQMPAKKRRDGSFKDIAHPLNSELREKIEKAVLEAYEKERGDSTSIVTEPITSTETEKLPEKKVPSLFTGASMEYKSPDQVNPKDYSAPDE